MSDVARSLRSIEADLEQAQTRWARSARTTLEEAFNCGALLLEAKEQMNHGEWGPWLERHFYGSETTARNWMRIAENTDALPDPKSATVADLSVGVAVKSMAKPKPKGGGAQGGGNGSASASNSGSQGSQPTSTAGAQGSTPPPSPDDTAAQGEGDQGEAESEQGERPVEQARKEGGGQPAKNGAEQVSAKDRKDAWKAYGVVVRFLDKVGEFDRFDQPLNEIAHAIRGDES